MASPLEEIKIALKITDANASEVVKKLESSFRGLAKSATQLDTKGISKVRDRVKSFDNAGRKNIETIRGQINAMQSLRSQAEIGSKQFRQLTADVNKYSQELARAEGRGGRRGIRGRVGGFVKGAAGVAGTALGAGVFGGPEGFAGATIGGVLGGVPGSIVGGAVGAAVGNVRQQFGQVAETTARFEAMQIALAGVSTGQEDYAESLRSVTELSERFASPITDTIQQYTKLKASVVGAGLSTKETDQAFRGLSAAVVATGGDQQDLNSALRAAAQVFSKGKVSAEELRQQIGERLPGAFTIFADSMGISTKQLDKLLERGEVTLDDFVTFTEELGTRFQATADELANSSQFAGRRLSKAFTDASIAYGGFFQKVGAGFQDQTTALLKFVTTNKEAFQKVIANVVVFAQDFVKVFKDIGLAIYETFGGLFKVLAGFIGAFGKIALEVVGAITDRIRQTLAERKFLEVGGGGIGALNKLKQEANAEIQAETGVNPNITSLGSNIREKAYQRYLEKIGAKQSQAARQARVADIMKQFELNTPTLFGKDFKTGGDGDSGSTVTSGERAASERMVTLTGVLADKVGKVGERELITLKYMIARQKVLDRNLKATDEQVALNGALTNFRKQIAALDEKEASAKDRALAKLNKFEQLEANLLAKKMGLTGEQTKQQLLQANINTLTDKYKQAMLDANIPAAEVKRRIEAAAQAMVDLKDKSKGFKEQFADGIKSMGDLTGNLANVAVSAFTSMSDKLHEFVVTGKASFSDFAQSLLSDLSRIFIRFAMFKLIGSLIPGLGPFLGFKNGGVVKGMTPPTTLPDSVSLIAANGMAFAKNKIVPYAKGGIVGSPTLFKYASGGADRFGLMGEAGPEAIMPLRRGANGKLGVEASGSSMGNITVNVDASGSSVQGDAGQGNQLGQALGIAIQQELMKQQRPGGLLAR